MKAHKRALGALTALFCSVTAAFAQTEVPDIYLRGSFAGETWPALDEYKFTKEGDTYTIHVDELDGLFKIASEDWTTVDLGGLTNDVTVSPGTATLKLMDVGKNITASNLKDVTITFTLDRDDDDYVTATITSDRGTSGSASGTLPILYIVDVLDTEGNPSDEILSKDLADKTYRTGSYWLDVTPCEWMVAAGYKNVGSADEPLSLQIKARGNYTRTGFSKKPFKLKLDKKQALLGMTKSKHWAILAHADDTFGYMRNFTGFNLGKRIGLPWTPAQQPVEVYINGDYRGLYFLTESIRVEDDRVPITELDDNVDDPSLATGGYLVELDNYDEDNQIRMEEKSCVGGYHDVLRITWDTPEAYSDLQVKFITQQFEAMNDAVGSCSDELWSYMDIDDAARYYLVEEICSHTESYHGSTYMFRDRGEDQKWHFSPLWDMGNAFSGPTYGHFYHYAPYGNTWIASMMQNSTFVQKVKDTWLWFMSNEYDGLYDELSEYASSLKSAAKADRARWKDAELPAQTGSNNPTAVVDNTDMDSRLATVKSHLQQKTEWLKSQFGDYTAQVYAEPARDTTPAAALPDFMQSAAIESVGADGAVVEGEVEYYNLQGIRVLNPAKGTPVIERRGTSSRVVIL